MLRALIWDVDGTIAETERDGHRLAFNHAFETLGLPWRWDVATYGDLLRIAGGRERLVHDLAQRAEAPAAEADRLALVDRLHDVKNAAYRAMVDAGGIPLRPGVTRLIESAIADGARLAIATTTSRGNVDALLRGAIGANWTERFDAVVCADEAPRKKPDPEVYRLALAGLAIDAADAVAIEDSPNGVAAARAAGIATLVTRSFYFADGDFDGATASCEHLDGPVRWLDGEAPCVDLPLLRTLLAVRARRPAAPHDR